MSIQLSIITTTFNSASTVRDTIESVLCQTYPDIEYIIKDGGSTDSTLEIVRSYGSRFGSRMKVISRQDKGIYDGMNIGLQAASGEVVGLLNSDDVLASPQAVESQMKMFEDPSLDAVYADVEYMDENLEKIVRYYSSAGFHPDRMKFGLMPAHPTFYCKKSVYERFGYFNPDYKVAADFECLLRFLYVNRIKTAYNPTLLVRMRSGGVSSRGLVSHRQIMKEHLRAFKDNGLKNNVFRLSLRYPSKLWDLVKGKFVSE